MIAICPAGPPKLTKPSLNQKRRASANATPDGAEFEAVALVAVVVMGASVVGGARMLSPGAGFIANISPAVDSRGRSSQTPWEPRRAVDHRLAWRRASRPVPL